MVAADRSFDIKRLCSHCTLCCSGALFIDVRLSDQTECQRLNGKGVELEEHDCRHYLLQPCACLNEQGLCSIYADRPSMCAEFECTLIKHFHSGETDYDQCTQIIQEANKRVHEVQQRLADLGNNDLDVPLFLRTEEVLSQPWDLSAPDDVNALRDDLFDHTAKLSAWLETHFLSEQDQEHPDSED